MLRGINSGCVDLIYLDPPFNKKKEFSAPIGSSAEGASFKDWFREEDVKDEWVKSIQEDYDGLYRFLMTVKELSSIAESGRNKKSKHYLYNYCYLTYMAIRLIEMKRVLKGTGSIYLHCDPTMSHYIKLLMDIIFGEKNFRNELVWCYTGPGSPGMRQFNRKHDPYVIFWWSVGENWTFNDNAVRMSHKDGKPHSGGFRGDGKSIDDLEYGEKGKVPETWWKDIAIAARSKKERTGYPTQKPIKLLERIIAASSKEGDTVLDPFCGCATTCVASEKLGRKWIGIDVSIKAYELVKKRLAREVKKETEKGEQESIDWDNERGKEIHFTTSPPIRTDLAGGDERVQKYVYVISNASYGGEYKVGVARDVKARLNSYQTADPNRGYELEFSMKTLHYREIERHIHEVFESRHEWVRGSLEAIVEAIKGLREETLI